MAGSRFSKRLKKLRSDPVGYLQDSRHGLLRIAGRRLQSRQYARFSERSAAAGDKKITVIMTAYNTSSLVEGAVQSVLAQSHQNLELMVIDDASNDDTLAQLTRLAAADKRMRVFTSPRNHGTYWSKNWCLRRAAGEFVAFHDSDDISLPDRLRVQLGALLDEPDAVACTCRWQRVDEGGQPLEVDGRLERMAAISLMIRKTPVLERAGYFDTVRIAADTEFIHRLKQIFGQRALRHLRHHLYTGLLREGSLTTGAGSGIAWQQQGTQRTRSVHGDRAAYYDAFSAWHRMAAASGQSLRVSFPSAIRPFDAADAMLQGCDDEDMDQVREVS